MDGGVSSGGDVGDNVSGDRGGGGGGDVGGDVSGDRGGYRQEVNNLQSWPSSEEQGLGQKLAPPAIKLLIKPKIPKIPQMQHLGLTQVANRGQTLQKS